MIKIIIIVLLGFIIGLPSLYSHPHMFIDTKVTIDFEDQKMRGFWIDWTFDRLFTEMIIVDYRLDRNREFTSREVATIKEGAFSNLRHFDYFTYIIYDGKRRAAEEVHKFTAFIRNNRLVYQFFVPFEVQVSNDKQNVRIIIYDETFFCDIAYVKDGPVSFNAPGTIKTNYTLRRNPNMEITYEAENATVSRQNVDYTGFVNPFELTLEFQKN